MSVHSNFQGVIITPPVGLILNSLQLSYLGGSYFNSKKEFKELFFMNKNHPRFIVSIKEFK